MNPMLPLDSEIITSILSHFQKTSSVVSGLVALIVTIRITILLITNEPANSYGQIFKDAVLYFAILNLFPMCFRYAHDILGGVALRFLYVLPEKTEVGMIESAVSVVKNSSVMLSMMTSVAPWLINHLAQALSTLLISILVAIGPVVIFMNTICGISRGVSAYFSALIGLCLWPLLWNLLGSLSVEIWPSFQDTSLRKVVYWSCVQLLQLASPLFCVVLFKTLSPGAAVSYATTKITSKISMKVG